MYKRQSNICSNHALNALTAAVYLGSVGESGFRALACENVGKLQKLVSGLEATGHFTRVFKQSPVFNEAVLASSIAPQDMRSRLAGLPVFPPLALARGVAPEVPGMPYTYLVCATEMLKDSLLGQVLSALS